MLSPVLLLKPQNTTTSLLFSKAPLAQNTRTNRIQSHITHIQHTSILPTLILTSVVLHPTTSFNPILIHSNTTPPFCHLLTQIFQSLHIAVAVPPLWNKLPPALRQISDPPYELTHTSPLAISAQLFHSKLKTLLFSNSYPDSSPSPYLPPRLNSKHHPP